MAFYLTFSITLNVTVTYVKLHGFFHHIRKWWLHVELHGFRATYVLRLEGGGGIGNGFVYSSGSKCMPYQVAISTSKFNPKLLPRDE